MPDEQKYWGLCLANGTWVELDLSQAQFMPQESPRGWYNVLVLHMVNADNAARKSFAKAIRHLKGLPQGFSARVNAHNNFLLDTTLPFTKADKPKVINLATGNIGRCAASTPAVRTQTERHMRHRPIYIPG